MKKIAVVGAGYVGISNAILLGKKNNICIYDVNEAKVRSVNARSYTEYPDDIATALSKLKSISATTDPTIACKGADLVVIAVPTDWNDQQEIADMSIVKSVVEMFIKIDPNLQLIIRSTVSIGFIDTLETAFRPINSIIYIPEFLREANLVHDTFHPSRFVIGINENMSGKNIKTIKHIFCSYCNNIEDNKVFVMKYQEAEAIKLLSNTYLAMRVAFFNEVDMLARKLGISSSTVINGISSDPRIGNYYNVPSFGFGGYCLPKDVRALTDCARRNGVMLPMIESLIPSNNQHLYSLLKQVEYSDCREVCILGLSFKPDTDDLRESPMVEVAQTLLGRGYELRIYDPQLNFAELVGSNKRLIDVRMPHLASLLKKSLPEALGEKGMVIVSQKCVELSELEKHIRPEHQVLDVNGWTELKLLPVKYHGFCWEL